MLSLVFFLFAFILSSGKTDPIYITPNKLCSSECTGSLIKPFDNLLDALQFLKDTSSATIIFLYNPDLPHYIFNSNASSTINTASYSTVLEFTFQDLTIQPLYCTDEVISTNSSLLDWCIEPDSRLQVYLKTTKFRINIAGNLNIKNIEFDAVENVYLWNQPSSADLNSCLYSKSQCCSPGNPISTAYPDTLICEWSNDYSSLSIVPSNSLFVFPSTSSTSMRSLTIEDSTFRNFLTPELQSIVRIDSPPFNIIFNRTLVTRVYFDRGLIYQPKNSSVIVTTNLSQITIQDSTFSYYNVWNMQYQSSSRNEGYLLNSQAVYAGVLSLTNNTFSSFTSSLRNSCWPQTSQYYKLPMNNYLTSDPRSRTNLWNQYHSEKGLTNDYISSLIYLKQLNGSVSLSSTSFKNIIGTSGSVLRVDDIVSSDNWFTTYDCKFENNFAYDRFANIMISKSSNPTFSSFSECPYHEIVNTIFKSTTGCPGAYGNILLLCYWDSQPPKSSLSNYAFDSNTLETSLTSSRILIQDSTFSNNSLAVSNSLAIIGSSSTVLENNTFQYNGGTTAQIATALINSSFIPSSYPTQLTHFGQSTAVYFDHFIKLETNKNTFKSNYGPWEGSLSLASALTLKNWLRVSDSLTLNSDKFLDHRGVPAEILKYLTDKTINTYMDPVITISVDSDGTSQLTTEPQSNALFNNVMFSGNKLAFSSTSFTYNSNELGTLFTNYISQDSRYTSGLVRVLYISEAIDDFSNGFKADTVTKFTGLTFQEGLVSQNEIIGMGCLFMSASLIDNLQVTNNIVSKANEVFTESQDYSKSYQMSPVTNNQGIFCITGGSSSTTLTINNLFAQKNTGIIINLFPNSLNPPSVSLMNSIFAENTCTSLSMITVRNSANFVSLNNIFTKNINSVGILYSYNANPSVAIRNIYLNNAGKYASLAYLDGSTAYEGFTLAKSNNVLPKYKAFAEGSAPQAALYFTNTAIFLSFSSQYVENLGYSGLTISYGGQTTFSDCTISQHKITGCAIVGTFMSLSNLQMNNVSLLDNKITLDPALSDINTAHVVLYTSTFNASNVSFIGGTTSGGAYLIYADITTGNLDNFMIKDVYRLDSGYQPLFYTTSSTWTVNSFQCWNSTGIFKVVGSQFALNSAQIGNLTAKYKSQFLFGLSATYLNITDLKYWGLEQSYSTVMSLFSGNKVDLRMINSHFYNVNGDTNNIFSLQAFLKILVAHSLFQFNRNLVQIPIFNLQTGPYVAIHSNTFIFCGPVFKVSGVTKSIHFTGNTLITNSHIQTFSLESNTAAAIYIIGNQFLRQNNDDAILTSSFPISQLKILDSSSSSSQDLLIQDNQFISLYGQTGIVMITGGTSPYAVNLKNNVFINNIASSNGGALYLQTNINGSHANLQNCAFILNNASSGKGGAIYQTSPNLLPQNTTIYSSVFINNSASITGGAIFFDYSLPNIIPDSNSVFLHNQAQRPNHLGSYPVQLVFSNTTDYNDTLYVPGLIPFQPNTTSLNTQSYKISNIGSGVPTQDHLAFVILDMFGQIFDSDDTSTLEIYPSGYNTTTARSSFSTQLSLQADSGMYILEDFTFNYRVNESILVKFTSSAIPKFNPIPVTNLTLSPNVSVEFSFRFCGIGEFIIKDDGYISCQECPAGYWQLEPFTSALACDACDASSTYCFGGSNIGPRPGYWRMNEQATLVLQCPLEAACIGNPLSGSATDDTDFTLDPLGKCADLRQGNLCDQCVPGWAKNSNDQCIQCSKNALPYFLLTVLMGIQIGLIAYSVGTTIESGNKYSITSKSELEGSPLMRILMNYSQIFALLLTIPISWPITIESVLSVGAEVPAASQELFSIDCFYNLGRERFGSYILFLRVLFVTTTPYALIVFAFIFWILYFLFKKIPIIRNKEFGYRVITTIVIICFERQSEVIQSAFTMFRCKNLYREDDPKYYLEEEYDVECWKSTHFKWISALGLPTLGIWVLALPIFMIYVLWRNRTKLSDLKIAKKYSFIYNGYHSNRFYWEIVLIVRKIFFISNVVFTRFVNVQIYISLILILVSYFLQELCKPYVKEELNKLERVGLISLGILNLCGLYFQIGEAYVDMDILLIIMAFGSNIIFIGYFFKLLIQVNQEKMMKSPKFVSAFRFIQKHCGCLMRLNCMKKLHNKLNVFEPIANSESSPQSPTDSLSINKNSDSLQKLNTPTRQVRPKFSSFALTPVDMSLKNDNENERQDNENMIMSPMSENLMLSERQFIFRSDEDQDTERNLDIPNLKSSHSLKPPPIPDNLLSEGPFNFGSDEDPDKEDDRKLVIPNFKSSSNLHQEKDYESDGEQ